MSNPDLYDIYDDEDAIAFIRHTLSDEMNKSLDDDDLYYIIDLIYDFYDARGYMDEYTEEDEDKDREVVLDLDEMSDFIREAIRKDGMESIEDIVIQAVVEAELDYEESLYDEDKE